MQNGNVTSSFSRSFMVGGDRACIFQNYTIFSTVVFPYKFSGFVFYVHLLMASAFRNTMHKCGLYATKSVRKA